MTPRMNRAMRFIRRPPISSRMCTARTAQHDTTSPSSAVVRDPTDCARRVTSGPPKRAGEFGELRVVQVRHCPERHSVTDPMAHVESANRSLRYAAAGAGLRPDKHVDGVLLPLVHERGGGPSGYVLEPAADQRKAGRRQIGNRGRKIAHAPAP